MGLQENIRKLRQSKDWTQEQLAERLGVARSTVTQWESGWSQPRMGMVIKLSELFNVPPAYLIEGALEDDNNRHVPKGFMPINPVPTVKVPVVGVVHAGQPIDYEEVDYTLDVPQSIIHHDDGYYGCIVEGDCMDRVYPEGCLVVVDTHKEPRDGSIGAFEIDGYQVVMRRVHRGANTLILSPESFNSEHRDLVFTEEGGHTVEAIGTVVWFQAKEEMD